MHFFDNRVKQQETQNNRKKFWRQNNDPNPYFP